MPTVAPVIPRSYHEQPVSDRLDTCGVDYLTVTQKHGEEAAKLWTSAAIALSREVLRGNRLKCSTWNTYHVERAGQVMLGERDDGIIAQLSGAAADRAWRRLLPLAGNVTRIDLQATGQYNQPRPSLARDTFRQLPNDTGLPGRPSGASIRAYRNYGDTLYLGSRASQEFGRHYDKSAELELAEKGSYWRWEVETKGAAARALSISLVGQEDPSTFIQNWVFSWFWKRGLRPGFRHRRCP